MNNLCHEEESRRSFFDALASEWEDRGFSDEELPKVERLRQRLGDLRGQTVLEPGCGAGRLTRLLSRWVGSSGRIIAVEVSPEMAGAAARTVLADRPRMEGGFSSDGAFRIEGTTGVEAIGCSVSPEGTASVAPRSPVSLVCSRVEDLVLPPESIDLALLFCVFPHLGDKGAVLRHLNRMLRVSGRLVVSHLTGSEQLNTMHEEAGEAVRRDRIPSSEVMRELFARSGFLVRELTDRDEEYYLEAGIDREADGRG